jgi:hypothetical protein
MRSSICIIYKGWPVFKGRAFAAAKYATRSIMTCALLPSENSGGWFWCNSSLAQRRVALHRCDEIRANSQLNQRRIAFCWSPKHSMVGTDVFQNKRKAGTVHGGKLVYTTQVDYKFCPLISRLYPVQWLERINAKNESKVSNEWRG